MLHDQITSVTYTPADLAIVIPSHSQIECLSRCLRLLEEHGHPSTQVIVVDDGSQGAAVSACARQFKINQIIRNEMPLGFCKAANIGLAHAEKPIVQLLNDDAWVTKGWADKVLPKFSDPKIGAVAPLVMMDDQDTNRLDSAGDRYNLAGIVAKRGHGLSVGTQKGKLFKTTRGRWVLGASASSAFYRLNALRQVAFLDESFGAYFEDVDLSFRLNKAGWRVWHEPQSLIFHGVSSSYGRTPKPEVLRMQSRNEERLFWRHLPAPWIFAALPVHFLALCAKALKNWQRGTMNSFFQGKMEAWAEALQPVGPHGKRPKGPANPWNWNLDLW